MLVRQEHLNQYGSLFGGVVLGVIDELAFIACTRAYPGLNFVTRAVLDAEFRAPAFLGDVLEFNYHVEHVGRTSVHVRVEILICPADGGRGVRSFDGTVVMVCVDDKGKRTRVR
jgi:acyl-CoA hydrolase